MMMIRLLTTSITILIVITASFSQCFTQEETALGFDNEALPTGDFVFLAESGFGEFSSSTVGPFAGARSLRVQVDQFAIWQVRMLTPVRCYFDINEGEIYTLSFYARGSEAGNEIAVELQGVGAPVQRMVQSVNTTEDWQLHTITFKATFSSTQGRVFLSFKNAGVYFLDDIGLNRHDCNGELGGTAILDACDICAGGSTGIPPRLTCDLQSTSPNNPNIKVEGVLESEITPTKATYYRFEKEYALDPTGGGGPFYRNVRATATAGVIIKFKTASPKVVLHLFENTTLNAPSRNKQTAVYKGDELVTLTSDAIISLQNNGSESVVWKFVLPVFTWYELLEVETLVGFGLEPIVEPEKPIYVAIGNSITHGTGTTLQRSNTTYARRVADNMGYELYNWGIGGSLIFEGVAANFDTGLEPDLITVLWGYNDVHSRGDAYTHSNTYPRYESLMNDLCSRFPDARIMAILPTAVRGNENGFHIPSPIRNLDSLRFNQQKILESIRPTCPNLVTIDGQDYTSIDGLADEVHFTDFGNSTLADGIIFGLNQLVLSVGSEIETLGRWEVSPNPISSEFTVSINDYQTISIYKTDGTIVKQFNTADGNKISVSNLANGIYILKIVDSQGGESSQLISVQKE